MFRWFTYFVNSTRISTGPIPVQRAFCAPLRASGTPNASSDRHTRLSGLSALYIRYTRKLRSTARGSPMFLLNQLCAWLRCCVRRGRSVLCDPTPQWANERGGARSARNTGASQKQSPVVSCPTALQLPISHTCIAVIGWGSLDSVHFRAKLHGRDHSLFNSIA